MVVLGKIVAWNSYYSLNEILQFFSVDRPTDQQTDGPTDRRTDRQTNLHIETPTRSLKSLDNNLNSMVTLGQMRRTAPSQIKIYQLSIFHL